MCEKGKRESENSWQAARVAQNFVELLRVLSVRPNVERADSILRRLEATQKPVALGALLLIMTVMVADVALRYFAGAPLQWAYDFIGRYLMVAVFFLTLGLAQREGDNIVVDVVVKLLPVRVHHGICFVGYMAASAVLMLVSYEGAKMTFVAWRNSEVLAGAVAWPTWPSAILVPIGAITLVFRTLLAGVVHGLAVINPPRRASGDASTQSGDS